MEYESVLEMLSDEMCYAKENFVPIIRDSSSKFLYDFVKENKVKRVLEIGTAIGFSGSIILSAGAEKLTTIDINEVSLAVAKNTFEKLGFLNNVEIIHKDAKLVLDDLVARQEKYDMIFLDGAKGQYINYLPKLTKLIDKNGIIFADNVLLQGMVESQEKIPHRKRTMVVNLRRYLDAVSKDPFTTEVLHLEDGIAITRFKGEKLC